MSGRGFTSVPLQPEKYWDTEFISHYQNTCKLLQFVHSKTILIITVFPEGSDRHRAVVNTLKVDMKWHSQHILPPKSTLTNGTLL